MTTYRLIRFGQLDEIFDSMDEAITFNLPIDVNKVFNSLPQIDLQAIEAVCKCLEGVCAHEIEDCEFGWHACCGQRDYKGHKKDCPVTIAQNLLATIKELK